MGGVCTGGTLKNGHGGVVLRSVKSFSKKKKSFNDHGNDHDDSVVSSSTSHGQDDANDDNEDVYHRKTMSYDSGELFFTISRELKPSTPSRAVGKAPHASTFLGKAGSVGLEVLDTLGSSMSNLNTRSGFVSNTASRGNKEILHSKGVQLLVSTDMQELLRIAAADKSEQLVFMYKLKIWTHGLCGTSELYHEYHALDRFEQDFRRKLDEVESLHLPRKGESIVILQSELKHQRKLVRNLKKKSLWSKSLEEVVEKLVDVVTFIHQAIVEAFEENVISTKNEKDAKRKTERLGGAGLALHYANLITQMDNIASRPTSLPPNTRDTLYNGLPASVKAGLRSRIQALDSKEVMTMPQIKAEMEKTLQWLVPVATDTTKAHQGFGWVGEWANTG
uniref:DUF668 domain-containing protein n=1 Tax=Tanacetum cinerariifolium TaxID=118510 RepID=A0A6L2LU12_TANCI|nr:hypothetical protein [Tanacetum cinerariifolium]